MVLLVIHYLQAGCTPSVVPALHKCSQRSFKLLTALSSTSLLQMMSLLKFERSVPVTSRVWASFWSASFSITPPLTGVEPCRFVQEIPDRLRRTTRYGRDRTFAWRTPQMEVTSPDPCMIPMSSHASRVRSAALSRG